MANQVSMNDIYALRARIIKLEKEVEDLQRQIASIDTRTVSMVRLGRLGGNIKI